MSAAANNLWWTLSPVVNYPVAPSLPECHYKLSPGEAPQPAQAASIWRYHYHKPSPWVTEQPRCLQLSTSTPPDSTQPLPHQDFPISEDSREVQRVITPSWTCLWLNETLSFPRKPASTEWSQWNDILEEYKSNWTNISNVACITRQCLILKEIVLTCEGVLHPTAKRMCWWYPDL